MKKHSVHYIHIPKYMSCHKISCCGDNQEDTLDHLRLHMVFTSFVNSIKMFFKQTRI